MEIRFPRCPVCGSRAGLWRTVAGYRIERCGDCGFGFVNPRPDRQAVAEMYRSEGGHCRGSTTLEEVLEIERRFPNSILDARRIAAKLARLAGEPGSLLDVGCGYGFFAAAAQRAGFVVDAIEIAPVERAVAAKMLGREPMAVEFEDLGPEQGPYDAVLISQVLEHAVDVNEWAAKARQLLRPGGALAIAVPNFESFVRRLLQARDPYVVPPAHLNYFARPNLAALLSKHGLEECDWNTVSRFNPGGVVRRLRLPDLVRRQVESGVRLAQRPLFAPFDSVGLGIFLNVYARAV